MSSHSSTLPFEQPFLPSIRPSWAELLVLAIALSLLLGVGTLRRGSDLVLPLAPLISPDGKAISSLSDPLLRTTETPVTRPVPAAMLAALYHGVAHLKNEAGEPDGPAIRQAFAQRIQMFNLMLVGVAVLAAFAWLKIWLRGAVAPAAALLALLLAVSPWHTGLITSCMMTSELMALVFVLITLCGYSVHPMEHANSTWATAPLFWTFGLLAFLSSEFSVMLPAYCLLVDLMMAERGLPLGRLIGKRFLAFYLPFGVLALLWIGLVGDGIPPLGGLFARMDQLFQMTSHLLDSGDFFALGRRPTTLGNGWGVVLILVLAAGLAARFRHTAYRVSVFALLAFLLALVPALLPGVDGVPFVSYTFLTQPTLLLLLAAATGLAAALSRGRRMVAPDAEVSDKRPSLTLPRWTPELQSATAVLAIILGTATLLRLGGAHDAQAFFIAQGKRHPELPELLYTASLIKLESLPRLTDRAQQREAAEVSAKILADSLDRYLDVRRGGFDGPISIPLGEFENKANILIKRRRLADAIPLIEEAVKLSGNEVNLRYKLASLHMMAGQIEKSKEQFELAFSNDPEGANALLLARQAQELGEYDLMAVYMDALANSGRARGETLYAVLTGLGQARILGKDPKGAIAPLEEAIKDGDRKGTATRLLLEALADAGRWDDLQRRLAALEAQPKKTGPPAPEIPKLANFVLPRLTQAIDANDGPAASDILEAWVRLEPAGSGRALALIHRGRFREAIQKPLEALEDYKAAVATAPDDGESYLGLADFYVRREFAKDAIDTLRTAQKLIPDNVEVLRVLVKLLRDEKRQDEALQILQSEVKRVKPPLRDASIMLANAYLEQSLNKSALEILLEARVGAPDDKELEDVLIEAYTRTPEFERGAELLVARIQKTPRDPELYIRLIDCFERNNDIESARQSLIRGMAACPPNAALLAKAGELAMKARDLPTAERSYARALELDPENGEAIAGMQRIAELKRVLEEAQELRRQIPAAPVATPVTTP